MVRENSACRVAKSKIDKIIIGDLPPKSWKQCYFCGEWFPGNKKYFYGDKTRTDGLCRRCKKCDHEVRMKNRRRVKRELQNNRGTAGYPRATVLDVLSIFYDYLVMAFNIGSKDFNGQLQASAVTYRYALDSGMPVDDLLMSIFSWKPKYAKQQRRRMGLK